VTPPTLVVLRALKLGDLCTAVPALRALARAFPLHARVLAVPAYLAPLARLTGAVDAILPTGELQPLDPAVDRPDVAVNLHGRGPQSTRLLAALHPRRLIAYEPDDYPSERHEVDRWCALLDGHGIAANPSDRRLRRPRVPPPARAIGATIVHPGASAPARRWPAERFAAVARAEAATGRRVVVTGDDRELALAHQVAREAGLPRSSVVAGRTSVIELAAAVAAAARVLTNDTGVAHLATAFATPSVVLFGPIPPAEWGPPADDARHVALWHGTPGGARGDPGARTPDPALLRIEVDEVRVALAGLPDGTSV
jgi:ADP-heptose:LPS heptosyltransferase